MLFELKDSQKNSLASLFEMNSDSKNAQQLFEDIEYQMAESFLPNKGSRKVVAIEKANLLKEISSAAKKLNQLLFRLDGTLKADIDSDLGKLGKPYLHGTFKINGEPALCWDAISTIEATRIIEERSLQLSAHLSDNFGAGYMEKVIEALSISWPSYLQEIPKITIDCIYVEYFGIILEESSYEKIYKQIKRSSWYANHQRYNQSHP